MAGICHRLSKLRQIFHDQSSTSTQIFLAGLLFAMMLLFPAGAIAEPAWVFPGLEVIGVDDAARLNIERSTYPERYNCEDADWQLQRFKRLAERQAIKALQALGYYNSDIDIKIERDENCWTMKLDIEPGDRVLLSDVNIEISAELEILSAMQTFLNDPPLQPGSTLDHSDYTRTKSEIQKLAVRYGFFDGAFIENTLEINPVRNIASASLIFEAGPRRHFGEITIEQSEFDEVLIDQYIVLESGQPFDSRELVKQQQILNASGYFESVRVIADHERVDDAQRVPVEIKLQEIKQRVYRFGVGASTDTGPRLSFGYENRRLNRHGHQFSVDGLVSPVHQEVTLDYGIPRGKAGAEHLDFQAGYLFEDVDTVEQESLKLAVLNTNTYDSGWIRTSFLEYLNEEFVVAKEPGSGELLMPGMRLRKTAADDALYPLNGQRMEGSIRLASDKLVSSTDFAQLTLGYKGIQPLFGGRLLSRLNLGSSGVGDFDELPASLRFFAGGDGSVRGFDYKTLGPLNDQGEVLGGLHLITASLEVDHLIVGESWSIAAFVDTGNAFNDWEDLSLFTGAGIGARWHSPIGPIRLDVAQDVSGEESIRWHLSMGLDL